MVFTKATEYSLKAIIYMARMRNQEFFGVKELADKLDVSASYLAKILQKLGRAGLLKSVTGPGGGFGLNREASKIRLMEILDCMDDHLFMEKCILGWAECGDDNPCPFHNDWGKFRQDLKKRLINTTVDGVSNLIWPGHSSFPGKQTGSRKSAPAKKGKSKGETVRKR